MVNFGILGPSDIAFRRFVPALLNCDKCRYIGVAVASLEERTILKEFTCTNDDVLRGYERAQNFVNKYGGRLYQSYSELLEDENIHAVYIPLPPALHYVWAKKALNAGKHVFVEKPFTTSQEQTLELIEISRINKLCIHENYMFLYHNQLKMIDKLIADGTIGEIRLYRMAFGFPKRPIGDFRYNKVLGGGALFDCGGYPIRLARKYLGSNMRLEYAHSQYESGIDVDIAGSAVLSGDDGMIAQIAFGMDNSYKCELEIWGSKGRIYTNRIFTAPVGYEPVIEIYNAEDTWEIKAAAEDTFYKSILHFCEMIESLTQREIQLEEIGKQSKMISAFKEKTC